MDKTKRIVVRFKWHCRRGGGLFLGMRIHFPCQVVYDNREVYASTYLSFGFLFATLEIEIRGKCVGRIKGNCITVIE